MSDALLPSNQTIVCSEDKKYLLTTSTADHKVLDGTITITQTAPSGKTKEISLSNKSVRYPFTLEISPVQSTYLTSELVTISGQCEPDAPMVISGSAVS